MNSHSDTDTETNRDVDSESPESFTEQSVSQPYLEATDDGVRCQVCGNEAASVQQLDHDCIYANDLVADGGSPQQETTEETPTDSPVTRYAKVNVIAPDGSVEDSVKVQFDYEQPLGIDPMEWEREGYFASDYSLELVYLHAGDDHYTTRGDEPTEQSDPLPESNVELFQDVKNTPVDSRVQIETATDQFNGRVFTVNSSMFNGRESYRLSIETEFFGPPFTTAEIHIDHFDEDKEDLVRLNKIGHNDAGDRIIRHAGDLRGISVLEQNVTSEE